jgi:hypothetical protein
MADVLTKASSVTCGHQGAVATSGDSRLQVNDSPVLLQAGVVGKSVSATPPNKCTTQQSNSTKPCASVTSLTSGTASKLRIGGQPVLLQGIAGTTDGNPPGQLASTANQSKLKAV